MDPYSSSYSYFKKHSNNFKNESHCESIEQQRISKAPFLPEALGYVVKFEMLFQLKAGLLRR